MVGLGPRPAIPILAMGSPWPIGTRCIDLGRPIGAPRAFNAGFTLRRRCRGVNTGRRLSHEINPLSAQRGPDCGKQGTETMRAAQANRRPQKEAVGGRFMAAGSTAIATAVALLMVLPSASAGALPSIVLKAPYKGTAQARGSYSAVSGCHTALGPSGGWDARTGIMTGAASSSAKSCPHVVGESVAQRSSTVTVTIPFKVSTTANHSVGVRVTVRAAATMAFAHGRCPALLVHYPPPPNSAYYAYCETGDLAYWVLNQALVDLSNSSWAAYNYTYVYSDQSIDWSRYVDCWNYGTPTCSNSSGNTSSHGTFASNSPGSQGCLLAGTCSFTMWSNSTQSMPRGDRWVLEISLNADVTSVAGTFNVAQGFMGNASASINLATLGNGVNVTSVTVT